MSRTGVTLENVVEAAEELIKSGETPTIDKVRSQLGGTGSFTTISKYLSVWRHGQYHISLGNKVNTPDLVHTAVERVWQQMREETETQITEIKNEALTQVKVAEHKANLAEEENILLHKKLQDLLGDHRKEASTKELLALELKTLREEHGILQERHKALDARYTDMQGLSSQHLKDVSEAHKNEVRRLEEKCVSLEKTYRQLVDEIKSQYDNERQQFVLQLNSLKTENKSLNSNLLNIKNNFQLKEISISELKLKLESSEKERDVLAKRIEEDKSHWSLLETNNNLTQNIFSEIQLLPKQDFNPFIGLSINNYLEEHVKSTIESVNNITSDFKKSLESMPFKLSSVIVDD